MSDAPTCTRPVRRYLAGYPMRRICGLRVLAKPNADGACYCWHHADSGAKAARKLALLQSQRLAAAGPDLLGFVRIVVTCSNDPQLVARGVALLGRVEGGTDAE